MSLPPDSPEGRQLITVREASEDLELEGYGCLKPVSFVSAVAS